MRPALSLSSNPDVPVAPVSRAPVAADSDPNALAQRLFGEAVHMVLVDDEKPAVSFMGWKLGSGHADCREPGHGQRTIDIEVLYSQTGDYAICERATSRLDDGATWLDASVTVLSGARDVRQFVETATDDAVRDMALGAALDHSARVWPPLRRTRRAGAVVLPFTW